MIKIRKISFIIIVTFSICTIGIYLYSKHTSPNKQSINKIFNFAKKTKPASTDELKNLLLDYSIENNIKKTILNFLQKTIGKSFDESNIKQMGEGLSGNSIFFIKDKNKKLEQVVKVFKNPFNIYGSFIRELSGFQVASTIAAKNFNFISAQAAGKCTIDNNQYGLLAISPASGTTVAKIILNISSFEPGSTQREDALLDAQKAVKKLGLALSELHKIRAKKKLGVHPFFIKKVQDFIYKAKFLANDDKILDFKMLEKYFHSLVDRIKNVKTTHSIAHSDANLKNFMYAAKTNSLFMVDLEELCNATDQNNNPISNAMLDLLAIPDLVGGLKINKEEYLTLKETFLAAYGNLPTGLERQFFTLTYKLQNAIWTLGLLQESEKFPPQAVKAFKDWLEFSVKDINKLLEEFEKEQIQK